MTEAPPTPDPPPPPPVARVIEPPPIEAAPLPVWDSATDAARDGRSALNDRDVARALRAFERALELNPALAAAQRGLGDAHLMNGDHARAAESYRAYLMLRPKADDSEEVRRLLRRAETHEAQR